LQYFFSCYKVKYTESTCDLKADVVTVWSFSNL